MLNIPLYLHSIHIKQSATPPIHFIELKSMVHRTSLFGHLAIIKYGFFQKTKTGLAAAQEGMWYVAVFNPGNGTASYSIQGFALRTSLYM